MTGVTPAALASATDSSVCPARCCNPRSFSRQRNTCPGVWNSRPSSAHASSGVRPFFDTSWKSSASRRQVRLRSVSGAPVAVLRWSRLTLTLQLQGEKPWTGQKPLNKTRQEEEVTEL